MDNAQELAVTEVKETAPLTAQEIKSQVQLIQEVMQAVMQEGYHYGVIPGTEKPTLLKPGAEKLTTTFRLAPLLHVEARELGNGHREYQVRCTLVHIPTARVYGEGVGSCSTLESRYRYRNADRTCPYCGRSTIIKGRAEYGGGWLCFQRKGGCGAKFADQDPSIVSQAAGRVENTDLADTYNTVLKMAKKRALVDATLTATGYSLICKGTDFSNTVATFIDANPFGLAADYSVNILWGDGKSSKGKVIASGSGFKVTGSHSYLKRGNYTVTVTIGDGGTSTASATTHINVGPVK